MQLNILLWMLFLKLKEWRKSAPNGSKKINGTSLELLRGRKICRISFLKIMVLLETKNQVHNIDHLRREF